MHWPLSLVALLSASPEITPEEFEKIHGALLGERVEKWQTVPWKVDLAAARRLAGKTGRPIFLWGMNGNPVGST